MTFGFGFCSVLYGVGFGSVRVLAHFFLTFGFGSVLGKTRVLVRFVLRRWTKLRRPVAGGTM